MDAQQTSKASISHVCLASRSISPSYCFFDSRESATTSMEKRAMMSYSEVPELDSIRAAARHTGDLLCPTRPPLLHGLFHHRLVSWEIVALRRGEAVLEIVLLSTLILPTHSRSVCEARLKHTEVHRIPLPTRTLASRGYRTHVISAPSS